MKNIQLSQNLNSHPMIPKLQSWTQNHSLSHFCFSPCAWSFSSEIHRHTGLNTASEPSEMRAPQGTTHQLRKELLMLWRPLQCTLFWHKWQWQFLRRPPSLRPESTKEVCSEATDLESKAEYVPSLSIAAILLILTLLSKVPQHTSRRSKSVKYNINRKENKIPHVCIWYMYMYMI